MKAISYFRIALLTVLMSVSFFACGGSDDDNGGSNVSASFEGEWHVTTLKGYEWDSSKNTPNLSNVTFEKTFGTTSDFETWVITKKDNGNISVKLMTDNESIYC